MVKKIIALICLVLFVAINLHAVVELDVDGNGGVDINKGGTNATSASAARTSLSAVGTTGTESVDGVKTFTSFPITPSSSPTTDYQVANKLYVDNVAESGTITSVLDTTGGAVNFFWQDGTAFTAADTTPAVNLKQHYETADTTKYIDFDGTPEDNQQVWLYFAHAAIIDLTGEGFEAWNRDTDFTGEVGFIGLFIYSKQDNQWHFVNCPFDTVALTKEVAWTITNSDVLTSVADGKQAFSVPAFMVGMNLTDVTATVYDLNSASGGTTTVVIRRSRAGADVDMTSTGVTIAYDAYTASDETVNTSNDDLALGDSIYVDVNAITTGAAQKGLSVTASFELP